MGEEGKAEPEKLSSPVGHKEVAMKINLGNDKTLVLFGRDQLKKVISMAGLFFWSAVIMVNPSSTALQWVWFSGSGMVTFLAIVLLVFDFAKSEQKTHGMFLLEILALVSVSSFIADAVLIDAKIINRNILIAILPLIAFLCSFLWVRLWIQRLKRFQVRIIDDDMPEVVPIC